MGIKDRLRMEYTARRFAVVINDRIYWYSFRDMAQSRFDAELRVVQLWDMHDQDDPVLLQEKKG